MNFQTVIDQVVSQDVYELTNEQTNVQSGPTGMFSHLVDAAITKIAAFRGIKDEETQKIIDIIFNVIEAIPLALQDLASATSTVQIVGALMRAFKMFSRRNIVDALSGSSMWIYDALKSITNEITSEEVDTTQVQGGFEFSWVVSSAKTVLGQYKGVKNCALVAKMQKLLHYFLSFGLFESFGLNFEKLNYSTFEAKKIRQEHSSIEGFMFSLLESIVWVLERGMQAVKLGSFMPFLHTSENYARWADEAMRVCEDHLKLMGASSLMCPIADQHSPAEKLACVECQKFDGLDEHRFAARLSKVLSDGAAIEQYATGAREKEPVKKMMRELRLVEARFLSKERAQRDRLPPFTLLVHGPTCVAKTMFMNICFQQYAKVHNKPMGEQYMWTRNSLDKFYSGYNATKWCIRLDDIAQYKATGGSVDPTLADVIMLCNGVTLIAPMAAVEDKGVIPVRPELVLASTNVSDLNASSYFACPAAVRRRFPFVVSLSLKNEYRLEGTSMLDTSKALVEEGEYQNIWNIDLLELKVKVHDEENKSINSEPVNKEIKNFKPLERMNIEFSRKLRFTEINDFVQYFSNISVEFKKNQLKAALAATQMAHIPICKKCYLPIKSCVCEEVQAGRVDMSAVKDKMYRDFVAMANLNGVSEPRRCTLQVSDEQYQELFAGCSTEQEFMDAMVKIRNQLNANDANSFLIPFDSEREIEPLFFDANDNEVAAGSSFEISDSELESLLEDKRSMITKTLDWVDDTWMGIHALAKCMACGVAVSAWGAADSILEKASDLMILYQFKKFKRILGDLGSQIYELFADMKIVGFCALLMSVWGIWKTTSLITQQFLPSPAVQTCGTVPSTFEKDDKPNPWIKEELILSEFQIPSKSRGWQSLSIDQIKAKMQPNVVAIKTQVGEGADAYHYPATALCVAGHVYMTNNHCIPSAEKMTVYLSQEPSTGNVGKNVSFTLSESMIYRIPEKDIAFFWCVLPPKMDTTELFMRYPAPGLVCNGFYVHHRFGKFAEINDVEAIRMEERMIPQPVNRTMSVCTSSPKTPTIFGDCGSPLIGMTQLGPVILGMHQTLTGRRTGANQVLAQDVDNAIMFFGAQIQCGEPKLVDPLGKLHPKSVLYWPDEGQAHVYGSTPRSSFRKCMKSRVGPTFIAKAAQQEGFERKHGQPVMKGPEVWHKNVEPTLTQNYLFDKGVLDECVQSFADDIIENLNTEQLSELIKLDDKTTMNGYPGVKFLDKINRQTSMGYPYRKSKAQFIVPCEEVDEWADAVQYVEEVQEEIRLIRDVYSRGERYMPVFVMSLKDEPVSQEKIRIKKTRGFMGGPAAWQFVMRQQLLSFVRVFQLNHTIFEGAPGLNCNSCEWEHLYNHITKFGEDRIVAGDYAKFDKRMSPLFILAAFDVIIRVLRAAGRSEEDLLAILCIAHDVAYPLTDVQGDFVEFFGSNPSGHALTVIVNCIVNSLYLRYIYMELNPLHDVSSFKEHVALMTYGDDNIFGVSECTPWFNHTTISRQLAKYDVVYTMADKESESVPYIHISEASFLKRRFVPTEGRIACPLEWDSIEKMLTSCVASRSVCSEEQAMQSIRSAIGEFFQYGIDVFDDNVIKMKRIVARSGLENFVQKSTFPTYEELLGAHADAGSRCRVCANTRG